LQKQTGFEVKKVRFLGKNRSFSALDSAILGLLRATKEDKNCLVRG
jgi:hypothetical protein